MFENILHQNATVQRLAAEITSQTLPSSLLFFGPEYSGKLTTALELARVLTCEHGEANWNCSCRSCRQQRLLIQPYTLMMGTRYFLQEVAVCAEALRRTPAEPLVYLYIRSVRKLARRFDDVLWTGDEARLAKARSSLSGLAEELGQFVPGDPIPEGEELHQRLSRMDSLCKKAVSVLPSDNIPVHMVRSVRYWARVSGGESKKVVIIENADRMHESSRNALLKVLEEPPSGVHFILLTTHKTAIIPTVLSRLRTYAFRERGSDQANEVVNRIFREPNPAYRSMRHFIFANSMYGPRGMDELAEQFLEAVTGGKSDEFEKLLKELANVTGGNLDRDSMRAFLGELQALCGRILISEEKAAGHLAIDVRTLEQWNALVREHLFRAETLNMQVENVLETLFLSMRNVA